MKEQCSKPMEAPTPKASDSKGRCPPQGLHVVHMRAPLCEQKAKTERTPTQSNNREPKTEQFTHEPRAGKAASYLVAVDPLQKD